MISEHIRDIKADCLKAKAAEDEAHSGEWTSTVLSKSCINLEKVVALTSKAPGNAVGASKHPHVQLARKFTTRNLALLRLTFQMTGRSRNLVASARWPLDGCPGRAQDRRVRRGQSVPAPPRQCALFFSPLIMEAISLSVPVFDSRGQGGCKPRAEGVHCHAQGGVKWSILPP